MNKMWAIMIMRRKTFADGGDVAKGFFCVETSAPLMKEEVLTPKHHSEDLS